MPASRARVRAFRDNVDPTTSEDTAAGYKYGDLWIRPGTPAGWVLTDPDAGGWTQVGAGGGGGGDHATLTNRAWVASLHTGTASRLAGFDGTGAAAYYVIGTGAGQVAAGDHDHDLDYEPIGEAAAEVAAHAAATDPHTGYQREAEKGAANGYASLGAGGLVPIAQLASGVPDGTQFVRDDGVLAVPSGGGGGVTAAASHHTAFWRG